MVQRPSVPSNGQPSPLLPGDLTPPVERQTSASARVVALIPAYNEERFIGSVVINARKFVDAVIVVDDGSTDWTAEVARTAGAVVVAHERNLGKGAALNTGFGEARRWSPQVLVLMDGDGQHMARDIPAVVQPVLDDQADMVVGSRFLGAANGVPRFRALGMRAITLASNWGSGVPLSDSQTGFRAFSRRAVEAISFHAQGFSVESEMQFAAKQLGLRVIEVPISASYRDRPKRRAVSQGMEVLNGILRLVGQHRPLLFFGVPGLISLLFGLWWGYHVVDIYRRTQQLAVGYALLAVLLCIVGSTALSTGVTLHSLRGLLLELVGPRKPYD